MRKKLIKILSLFICILMCAGCEKTNEADEYTPQIIETGVSMGEESPLSYIPNKVIEENSMQEIMNFQNDLLSTYYVYDAEKECDVLHIRIISMDTGELKYETELQVEELYAITIQVCENKILVNDGKEGKIHIFDNELKETDIYDVEGNYIYVDSSMTTAYCVKSDEGIQKCNLKNNKEENILENVANLTICSSSEKFVTVKYIDLSSRDKRECYAGLNLETGKIEKFEIDDSFSEIEYFDGKWAGKLLSDEQIFFVGTQENSYKFESQLQYPSIKICSEEMHLMITTIDENGKQTRSLYDKDGKFISSYSTEKIGQVMSDNQVWVDAENGYLFLAIDENGNDKLYFWNLEQKTKGENLEFIDYDQETENKDKVLEQKYYEEAESLAQEYGVTIKIAEQCETDYEEKFAEQECDEEKISLAFTHLKTAFSNYPEGFFEQLRFGAYRKIEINLMGAITNANENEVYTSNAFVQLRDGKIVMVLNISEDIENLERTFYHESSHMIDAALEHDSTYRKDAVYSEKMWETLNPESFISLNSETGGYFNSYEMMPMEYYQEEFGPYFVDDYGKTFSTEDRATIFENAMIGNKQQFSTTTFQPLYNKLEYYCKSIRDYFDTTGWPECTAWEECL